MNVLVTGAGGFVCRSIVEALLNAGHTVIAVDRAFDADLRRRWQDALHLIEADAGALPAVAVDALVHGAAVTASPEDRQETPEANFQANVEPLLAALEWAREQRVGRSVMISSSAVYANTLPGPVPEDQPVTPDGLYAVAKATLEALVATLRRRYARDALVIRLSSVYGPGEFPRATRPRISQVGQMLHDALTTGQVMVDRPDTARDWTFAPDIGRVVERLLTAPALNYPLYNVASQQVLTDLEIARHIQAALPGTEIRIANEPVSPALTRRGWLANDRLRDDLGFNEWTLFQTGLAQMIEAERL